MTRWPAHRIRALLLALLLALGMGSTIVQGGLMAAEMAVSAKAGLPGPSGCDACGDGETLAGMCLSVCGSAAQVILPGEPVALRSARRAGFQAAYLVLGGRSNSPDHGPPKLPTLG